MFVTKEEFDVLPIPSDVIFCQQRSYTHSSTLAPLFLLGKQVSVEIKLHCDVRKKTVASEAYD